MSIRRILGLRYSQAIPAVVGVAVLLLFSGCEAPGPTTLGSEDGATDQAAGVLHKAEGGRFVFHPFGRGQESAPVALSKPALRVVSATKTFLPGVEDEMRARHPEYVVGDQVQAKKAVLVAREESVPPPGVTVEMSLYSGTRLEDISVAFEPSGYEFERPARLRILLKGELTEEEVSGLQAYHISGDTVEPIDPRLVLTDAGNWRIIIRVPGFSEYSLGGDDDDVPPDEADGGDPP